MSLPNYLAKIKSAGIYRFVWDKSEMPPQQAETLRLVVGYSEKGPFNTPVYIESASDFTTIYGNISKRLERKGIYFHRLALQALSAGPILAFNVKPFSDEEVGYVNFDADDLTTFGDNENQVMTAPVVNVYDTNRFWAVDADSMVAKLNGAKYMTVAATDTKENACTVFIRKYVPDSYKGITLRSWSSSQSYEYPEYLEELLDTDLSEYFAEMYVFRGDIKPELYEREEVLGEDGEVIDTIYKGALSRYLVQRTVPVKDAEGNDVIGEDGEVVMTTLPVELDLNYVDAFGDPTDALEAMAADSNSNFIGSYAGITIPYFKDANGNYISLDLKFNSDYNKHKMLMKLDDKVLDAADNVDELKKKLFPSADNTVRPVYIPGYTYTTIGKSDTGEMIWKECVKILKTKGIRTALTNRVDVEYHYLVDTFDSEAGNTKGEFFKIAQDKDNAFAIVNFPKMAKFHNPAQDLEAAVRGFKLKMPSEVEGASFGAYYTQLTFSDGTVKTVVPSAALVSNLFMNKWGARQPYYIVAGPTYGRLSYSGMVGPDYNFGRSDLDILEPMGVNAIIYVPRKGTYINSNQTAKQVPVSGLSKIHIRELVIYLQNEVEHLLQSYQWELNTQVLRDTIKSKADAICDTIKNNGGIYEYVNICDSTNNTPEVIDNEMIILDTEIEPARGAGKMIHQLTIHKTGALTSRIL